MRKSLWEDRARNRESRRKAASERELVPREWNTGSISVTEKLVLPLWNKLFWPLASYLTSLTSVRKEILPIPPLIHSLSFRAGNDLTETTQRDKTKTEACTARHWLFTTKTRNSWRIWQSLFKFQRNTPLQFYL